MPPRLWHTTWWALSLGCTAVRPPLLKASRPPVYLHLGRQRAIARHVYKVTAQQTALGSRPERTPWLCLSLRGSRIARSVHPKNVLHWILAIHARFYEAQRCSSRAKLFVDSKLQSRPLMSNCRQIGTKRFKPRESRAKRHVLRAFAAICESKNTHWPRIACQRTIELGPS